jgi:hypothetical protein
VHATHSVSAVDVHALFRYVDPLEHAVHVWQPSKEPAPMRGLKVPVGHALVVNIF